MIKFEHVKVGTYRIVLRKEPESAYTAFVPSLPVGTLSSILSDVATHFKQPKEEIAKQLFG